MTLCLECGLLTIPAVANAVVPILLAQAETPGPVAPAQPPAQQPYTIPRGAPGPKRIAGHEAIYPQAAKAQHLGGVVTLHAIIDTDGNITQLKYVSATDPIFVDAAMAAVRQWKYSPYLLNGVPIAVQTTITMNFSFGN